MSKALEEHYQALAEVYMSAYEDETKLSKRILTAMGVIVSMHSELLSYRLKNASNEKVKKQEERLMLLEGILSEFSTIADRNWQLRHLLQQKGKEIDRLSTEKETLNAELSKYKEQLEQLTEE
jgi:serine phosphatase RsbU (regulator of sigma subunit)